LIGRPRRRHAQPSKQIAVQSDPNRKIVPITKNKDQGPDYRVLVGTMEMGIGGLIAAMRA